MCALSTFYFLAGGFTKEAMKMIEQYRTKDRYEQSPDTTALVNAKYQ